MKTVLILKGLPASGKSTWAREQIDLNHGMYKRVNKDDLRSMLDNSIWSGFNEKFVIKLRDEIIISVLNAGKHVIVDDTNLDPKHEEHIKQLVKNYNELTCDNVKVEIKFFDISVEEAIKRDLKRQNSVGQGEILKMYNDYLKPKIESNFKILAQNSKLPHCIICDIDGTLAIRNGRSPFDWDKVDSDLPNNEVCNLISMYSKHMTIIFVSGRKECCKVKTLEWLEKNVGEISSNRYLYMRADNDNRPDEILKKEIFLDYIRRQYFVEFVVDDRNKVVKMWRELGLTCLQIADGDF